MHGDEETNNNQLPPPPNGYPLLAHTPPTCYPRPTNLTDTEQLAQYILNNNIRSRISSIRKQNIDKLLITMSSIVQDTIRDNERETGDIITAEIFST